MNPRPLPKAQGGGDESRQPRQKAALHFRRGMASKHVCGAISARSPLFTSSVAAFNARCDDKVRDMDEVQRA